MIAPVLLLAEPDTSTPAPTPAEVVSIDVIGSDYPTAAIIRRQQGNVGTTILVRPDGTADWCELTRPSGMSSLDLATCAGLLRSTRFRPAADAAGVPAHALIEVPFVWRLPSGQGDVPPFVRPPDYELTIRPRAGKTTGATDVTLAVSVSTDGGMGRCGTADDAGEPMLARAACGALPGLWVRRVVEDTSGAAVPYVRTVVVRFQIGA